MNFSGISSKNLIGKSLRFFLRILPSNMKVRILQGKLRGLKWIVGSGNHGYWLGSFEFEKQKMFIKVIKSGSVLFDIGANSGFYTLLASKLVDSHGQVFSFEPLHENISYLREHLKINHISNVKVIEAAVSNRTGYISYDEGPNRSMARISPHGKLNVPTVCIDEMITNGEVSTPDFIKIDVEGAEMLVLSGAKKLLEKFQPILFLATHGSEIHKECCRFLEIYDYQLFPIVGGCVEETDEIIAIPKNSNSQQLLIEGYGRTQF